MSDDQSQTSPEREQTDESLRTEREKTDRALAEKHAAVERQADSAIRQARVEADAQLGAAREKADHLLRRDAHDGSTRADIAEERANEDKALRDERVSADESLRGEREENARLLAMLLPLEREKTDRFLLTERIRSDDALAQRDDFLAIVSHDLRNLLGGILMSSRVLAGRAPAGPEGQPVRDETARIRRYAARMNRLVGDLVDVVSMDAGMLSVDRARGDLGDLVDESIEMFQPSASAGGITLAAEAFDRPAPAEFDHGRMLQVLANLIGNAIKFTPAGGRIALRVDRDGEELRISVCDTGRGIPENMLETIFERFWQVGKDDRRGAGLGLYISKCIVEAHGGRIWATSTPGVGSTFSFTISAPPSSAS